MNNHRGSEASFAGPSSPSSRMLGDVARARIRASTFASTARSSRSGARVARASGASEDDRGPKPRVARARARRRGARPRLDDDGTVRSPSASTSTSASSTTRGTALTEEEKSARLEALRLRDLRLRVEPLVDALESACERDEIRAAQKIKSEIADRVGDDDLVRAMPPRAHAALLSAYCRARLNALAERAFADLLRSGASPTPEQIWEMVESFESGGEEWARKTEDALAYLETLSRD